MNVRSWKNTQSDTLVKAAPKHLVFVVDTSGSMYVPLEEIRRGFKDILLTQLQVGDELTVMYFSGRGQVGTVISSHSIDNPLAIEEADSRIQKWLQPIGLTCFEDPLKKVEELIHNSKLPVYLHFMSDGMDNQSHRADILTLCQKISGTISGAEVVEYGNFADRALLAQMASILGGEKQRAESPKQYLNSVVKSLSLEGAKKVKVGLGMDVSYVTVFFDDTFIFADVVDGQVEVPENYTRIVSGLTLDSLAGIELTSSLASEDTLASLYAFLTRSAQLMDGRTIDKIARVLGDVYVSKLSLNLFGKQRYSDFETQVRAMTLHPDLRFQMGFSKDSLPAENSPTVPDILRALSDGQTRLRIDSPDFVYKSVSRKRHARTSEEEKARILEKFKDDPSKQAKALDELVIRSGASAKFEKVADPDGYTIVDVVSHKERANLSMMIVIPGTVSFNNVPDGMPQEIESKIFRNYAAIFDGITQLEKLPIRPGPKALKRLQEMGVLDESVQAGDEVTIDLINFPMANRATVQSVSAVHLASLATNIQLELGRQKIIKERLAEVEGPLTSRGLASIYGEQNAEWLRTVGVTDNGFNPPREPDEATDATIVNELHYSVKGLMKFPTTTSVKNTLAKGRPFTKAEQVIFDAIQSVEGEIQHGTSPGDTLTNIYRESKLRLNQLRDRLEAMRFAVLVGGAWFDDLDASGTVNHGALTVEIELREATVPL